MRAGHEVLIVGGYGEVGQRLVTMLGPRVVVGGRHPERVAGARGRRIDVDDPASIEQALDGISLVVGCVREREPHLLEAAVRRGIAYTSIAPPRTRPDALVRLHGEAKLTGARVVLGTGIEPGIANVLARIGANRVGEVDAVETALLLGVGDVYGADSMAFVFDEFTQAYTIVVDGHPLAVQAFDSSVLVDFPHALGRRRAYPMPFSDQFYYPMTLGARSASARLALDPPWLGSAIASLTRVGGRGWVARGSMRGFVDRLRRAYASLDQFALVVDVRGRDGRVRSTLVGRVQAHATAAAAAAVAEALHTHEVEPGVWLAEEAIAPSRFLERLASRGLVPVIEGASIAVAESPRFPFAGAGFAGPAPETAKDSPLS